MTANTRNRLVYLHVGPAAYAVVKDHEYVVASEDTPDEDGRHGVLVDVSALAADMDEDGNAHPGLPAALRAAAYRGYHTGMRRIVLVEARALAALTDEELDANMTRCGLSLAGTKRQKIRRALRRVYGDKAVGDPDMTRAQAAAVVSGWGPAKLRQECYERHVDIRDAADRAEAEIWLLDYMGF